MVNLLRISWHGVNSAAPDKFPISVEAREPFDDDHPAYYRLTMGGIEYVITEAHRLQILNALSSAPPLPKPEPECACILTGDRADASECDLHGYARIGDDNAPF